MNGMVRSPNHPVLARQGLWVVFGSTFLELVGVFMLSPLLLLLLKAQGHSTVVAGLFAAVGWLGIFAVMPWVSGLTRRLGRRKALWLAAGLPVLATLGFLLTDSLAIWWGLTLLAGMAGGLRWVLAEAAVAEFAPPGQRGRWVGLFEAMVGLTFVLGPALLAWLGTDGPQALWVVLGLMVAAFITSLWIPHLPLPPDSDNPRAGRWGLWHALRAHPVVMVVGLVGGFFESGLSSLLPLYGLALGLTPALAALLVSASGLGSSLMMLPAGMLADAMARHPQQRWGSIAQARRTLMQACAVGTLCVTLLVPWLVHHPALAWPLVFVWGGAGGCLYTLAMIDIGDRETGLALVNSTSVLVMSYTLGGLLAPALGGMALQWSPTLGFPALLLAAAGLGVAALYGHRSRW